jgi:hypothetical protein
MKVLLFIINFIVWILASFILIQGYGSLVFGILYFIIGFPLSLILIKISDNYAVSFFDKLNNPPFTVLIRKLVWSNGVATSILWICIFLITFLR